MATTNAVKKIKGAFAFCAIHNNEPDKIVVAKRNAPLIIGVGENENFIASDIPAIIEYTKKAHIKVCFFFMLQLLLLL